jgi:hypothetical protein
MELFILFKKIKDVQGYVEFTSINTVMPEYYLMSGLSEYNVIMSETIG